LDFRTRSVADLAADVRAKKISARELVRAALDRVEALNPTYNAFTQVDADLALKDAAAVDERIARGEDVGPLAGIPIGVKDNEDAKGFRTTSGSPVGADKPPVDVDTPIVERLKNAGCVVIGKTNMPEFGLRGESDNRTFGISRNPWNTTRTPGGSSGGTAAALASGMVPLATGSDGGGSIRIPSAVTGLSGFKPSLGRIPDGDLVPPGWPLIATRGAMALRTTDVALADDVVVGPHPWDIRSLPAKTESWLDAANAAVLPKRIAYSRTLGYATVDNEIAEIVETAVRKLEAAGAEVVEVDDIFASDPGSDLGTLVGTYTARNVEPYRDTKYWSLLDPWTVGLAEINRVSNRSALDLVEAEDNLHHLNVRLQQKLAGFDLIVCPATQAQTAMCEVPVKVDDLVAVADEKMLREILGDSMDVLLDTFRQYEPVNAPIGMKNGVPVLEWHGMTQAFNVTRSPAGVVNCGFTSDGMPVALRMAGQQFADTTVLSAMSAMEQIFGISELASV
jgi:aspartyl-tRNA(Asn)/glutamyl-tRNA(Gln) amidotransferase subunit A